VVSGGVKALGQPALIGIQLDIRQQAWSFEADGPLVSAPASRKGSICCAFATGCMAVNPVTGHGMWPEPYRPPRFTHRGALTSPIALSDSMALFGCGHWIEARLGYALHAVDLGSGRLKWSAPLSARLTIAPEVVGSLVIAVEETGWVSAFDLVSGRRVWGAQAVRAPAKAAAIFGDYVLIANSQQLVALRFRPLAVPPSDEPAAYAARGAWSDAAVAFALRGELAQAGDALLRAGDARHALRVFERCQDQEGMARAFVALQSWPEAIEVFTRLGDRRAVAAVLAQSGRHAEAARQLEALTAWGEAGIEYEKAGQPLEAARCYAAAGDEEALQRLAGQPEAGRALAEWLAETEYWRLAIPVLLRLTDWNKAVRLYQSRRHLREAFELCWQHESWEQCRAMAQEMNDRRLEARVCLQQQQYVEAGRLFEELNQWDDAYQCYERGNFVDGSLRALAGQGRHAEAADRLMTLRRYGEAGQAYRLAAEQAAHDPMTDRAAAAKHWRRAAEGYALDGFAEEARDCRVLAAQALAEPILELAEVRIDTDLMVGHESRLNVAVANNGFGPAQQVRVLLDGRGFGYERPTSVGNVLDVLPKQRSGVVQAGVLPKRPGQEVELRLTIVYSIGTGSRLEIGPFQAFLTVRRLDESKPASIHIGNFEYIGPGGVHARDTVMIRSGYSSQRETLTGVEDTIRRGVGDALAVAPTGRSVSDRFCPQCGLGVSAGSGRCANQRCRARLCIRCGAVLAESADVCPACETVQTTRPGGE
jgi:hypothetical protein